MPIQELVGGPPMRSRTWTREDADAAFAILTREGDPGSVKFGEYALDPTDGDDALKRAMGKAHSDGAGLVKLIDHFHNRKFATTAWRDGGGVVIGALLPKAARQVTRKPKAKAAK